jgi:hypothetical protein
MQILKPFDCLGHLKVIDVEISWRASGFNTTCNRKTEQRRAFNAGSTEAVKHEQPSIV